MARSLRIGLVAGLACLTIAVLAYAQTVAYPVAPNGTPVGYIPETVNTIGQTVWVPAADAGSGVTTLAGDVTGASNANTVVSLTGSAGTTSLKSNLTPSADIADSIGSSSFRLGAINEGVAYNVYGASGDSNPAATYALSSCQYGPGGASGIDTVIKRAGVSDVAIANGSNGAAQLEVGGTGGTQVQVLSTGTLQIPGPAGNSSNPASLNITAQNPGASCTGSAPCTPGSINLNVGAKGATGSPGEGTVTLNRGGALQLTMHGDGSQNGYITTPGAALELGASGSDGIAALETGGFFPTTFGGLPLGVSSLPWGATFVGGASTLGYVTWAAAGGTHNTQDATVNDSRFSLRTTNGSFGPFNAQTYTLAAHHGVTIDCEATGRIVTSGSGGTFWTAAADNTYGCRVAATAAYTGAAGLGNALTYLHCDCSGGACSSPSSPTNPLLVFASSINTGTGVAQVTWSTFSDGSTTKPVVDIVSHCIITDD